MKRNYSRTSIGIDVAKAYLDCYSMTDQSQMRFVNDAIGISKLLEWSLSKTPNPLLVLEPTGGYEKTLEYMAHDHGGIAVTKVNAKYIRDFARAKGRLAKTDSIDAQIIAEYGAVMSPRINIQISQSQRTLKELVMRRRQITEMYKQEKNRLDKRLNSPVVVDSIKANIERLKAEQKTIEKNIQNIIVNDQRLYNIFGILQEMVGVGAGVASNILAELPEIGHIGNKAISSLVGVAPHNVDSGNMRGRRCIKGGRKSVRNMLYMAALTAIYRDGPISDFYQSLVQKGKMKKVAIVACMRKMLIILNARVRDSYQITT